MTILLPRGIIRLSSGAVLLILVFYLMIWTRAPNTDAYTIATQTTLALYRWIDVVAIHRPETDFQRKSGESDIERQAADNLEDLWGKLKWFFALWTNQRGIGWNIEPPNLPQLPKDYSKSLFIKQTVISLLGIYLSLDLVHNLRAYTYAAHAKLFFSNTFGIQILSSCSFAIQTYLGIGLFYALGAFFTIIPGLCVPNDWPPIFGSFIQSAWSVRKVWGTCWHQLLRRPCSEAGRLFRDCCRFKKGSFLSRYSQVWIGFAVSALLHHSGAVVGCFEDGGWTQGVFFMVQPLGIMIEDGVMGIGKRMGVKEDASLKRIGFLWTFLWFTFWLRYMVAGQPRSWAEDIKIPSLFGYVMSFVTSHPAET